MYLSCRLTILFAILLVSLPDLAISAFLTSGQLFNLTTVQGALLKQEPGIDILPCQTQGISKDSTEPQFSAKHYQAARDESLYSDQKNMTADLKAVDASQKTKAKANVVNEPSNLTQMKDKKSGIETEFILSMGYRVDDIDWNIAGNTLLGNYVNVLGETTRIRITWGITAPSNILAQIPALMITMYGMHPWGLVINSALGRANLELRHL